jgi:tRNA dimethylallyltransferase
VEKDWLNARITQRFDTMLDTGALEEAQKNLENWDPALLSNRAIGAPELVAHLQGKMTLEDAREAATIATRQFAKRQRTWFRSKMKDWLHFRPAAATK